jgi:hypothetical protein
MTAAKHVVTLAAVVVIAILALSGAFYFVFMPASFPNGSVSSVTSTTVSLSVASGPNPENVPDYFSPQNFTVTEGQRVTLVFDNTDDTPHELAIPALNVTTGIVQSGQIVRIVFIPNKIGTFGFGQPGAMCKVVNQGAVCNPLAVNGNVTVLAP